MTWLLLALAAHRQTTPSITDQDKSQAIKEFCDAFEANYVFPDIAKKTVADLKSKLDSHTYDRDADSRAFIKHINTDLADDCHDAHLHLNYSADPLPKRERAEEPSPDEIRKEDLRTRQLNAGVEQVQRLDGNIGYLEVRGFLDPKAAARPYQAAFEFLANCDALVLDLRRNGGGDPQTVQILCSYLFGKKPVHLNDIYVRQGNQTKEFWTLKNLPAPRFENKPVYVLVSHRTGSGAEECAYNLQNLHRATIIGASTWGGANPGGIFRLDDHFSAFIPVGRAVNPYTHTNWEGTGVIPDVKEDPSAALSAAEKLAIKQLLSEAKDPDEVKRLSSVMEMLDKDTKPQALSQH